MLKALLLIGLFAILPQQAFACSFTPFDFSEQLARTQTAFIGPVVTDEMGLLTLRAEKGIKGIDDGVTVDVAMGKSSCHLRMAPGQVWLFMGDTLPSGSRMLMDEYGRINAKNAQLVKEKFGYDVSTSPTVRGGLIEEICSPVDGAAFRLTLDNGTIAYVYAPLEDIETDLRVHAVDHADHKRGGGVILNACDAKKRHCKEHSGQVSLGFVKGQEVSGQVVIFDGEHKSTHVFRVRRSAEKAVCG